VRRPGHGKYYRLPKLLQKSEKERGGRRKKHVHIDGVSGWEREASDVPGRGGSDQAYEEADPTPGSDRGDGERLGQADDTDAVRDVQGGADMKGYVKPLQDYVLTLTSKKTGKKLFFAKYNAPGLVTAYYDHAHKADPATLLCRFAEQRLRIPGFCDGLMNYFNPEEWKIEFEEVIE